MTLYPKRVLEQLWETECDEANQVETVQAAQGPILRRRNLVSVYLVRWSSQGTGRRAGLANSPAALVSGSRSCKESHVALWQPAALRTPSQRSPPRFFGEAHPERVLMPTIQVAQVTALRCARLRPVT